MKTNELSGAALDWAVAKCEDVYCFDGTYAPSTNWAQGGPIIKREWISLWQVGCNYWKADKGGLHSAQSETPLIAAMRCYVVSKLGDKIELPEGLTYENAY